MAKTTKLARGKQSGTMEVDMLCPCCGKQEIGFWRKFRLSSDGAYVCPNCKCVLKPTAGWKYAESAAALSGLMLGLWYHVSNINLTILTFAGFALAFAIEKWLVTLKRAA